MGRMDARFLRGAAVVAASLGMALTGACARQGAPPGGPEDRRPPVVVRTEPDTFATLEDFRGPVRFHFDERISERVDGSVDDVIIISPATGDVRVSLSRRSLSVELDGGFEPGIVYRVTLLPAVRDMFNNQLKDPFELVFSTGGEFTPSAVAGLVWDRITGEGVEPAEVRAFADTPDSAVYLAQTDTGGVYALRYLPPGRYRIVAFQDRNQNDTIDLMETQGVRGVLLNNPTDTVILTIPVLLPDTSRARVTGTEILDSVTVMVEFDDYLDPAVGLENVGAALSLDSGAAPGVQGLYHAHEYSAFVLAVTDSFSRLDSLEALARGVAADAAAAAAAAEAAAQGEDTPPAGDTAQSGEATQPGDTTQAVAPEENEPEPQEVRFVRVPPPTLPGTPTRDPPLRPDGSDPPSRRIVLVLAEGLVPNQGYQLTITGVVNINSVPQGGGEAAVVLEPPPDTTSVVVDSTVVEDTLAVPPDTGSVRLRPEDLFRRRREP